MDIPLLKSTFAGNAGAGPAPLKPVTSPHTKPPATMPAGETTVTTYNSRAITQDEPVARVLHRFGQQAKGRIPGKSARLVAGFILPGSAQTPSLIVQGRIKSEAILPGISNKLPVSRTRFEKGKNSGEMPVAGKKPVNRKNTGELLPEVFFSNGKTTIAGEKPVITPALLSNRQNQRSGKQSIPAILISDNKVLTAQDSSIPAAEKTISNKAGTARKGRYDKMELFELPVKNRVRARTAFVKSVAQKLSQPHTRLSASQAENRGNLLSPNPGLNPDTELSEQLSPGNNPRPIVAEQLPASGFAKVAGNADSGAAVGEQVQGFIHASLRSGNRQVVIQLNPPELGKVAIKFEEQGNNITGLLQVDKPQTRNQIEQALPEIIQNLQDCGIQIKKLEVVLTEQQDQYALKDQSSGQDRSSGRQSSPEPESQRSNTTYNEWFFGGGNVMEFAEIQACLTDSSINILI